MKKISYLAQVHYNQYRKGLLEVENIKIPWIKEEVKYLISGEEKQSF